VRQDRILGLPLWTSSETYNFVAKSVGPATIPEQWQMLGLVLEDRFKLKSHRETRQMPVYDLSAQASGIKFPEAVPGGCTPRDVNAAPPTTPEEARKRAENMCGTGNPKNRSWISHIKAQVFAKKGHVVRQVRGNNSPNG
jgi:uncharacterized protein (TIGR03435 family)